MKLQQIQVAEHVAQDLIVLQGAELVRLRNDLDKARDEIETYRAESDHHDELCKMIQELRSVVETQQKGPEVQTMQEEFHAVKVVNESLRRALKETRASLRDALIQNVTVAKDLADSRECQRELGEQLKTMKAWYDSERKRLTTELAEADEFRQFLDARLDEMEESMRIAQKDQEWTETELSDSCRCISGLLSELSEQQAIQKKLEDEASAASSRRSGMNKWLLRSTQNDLKETKESEAALAVELAETRSQLVRCQSELENIKVSERQAAAYSAMRQPEDVSKMHKAEVSVIPTGDKPSSIPPGRHYTSSSDPHLSVTAGGVLEDMFVPISSKRPDLEIVREVLAIRSIAVVLSDDFVWHACPDTAYFVKPARVQSKGDTWKACKIKAIKRLQREEVNELLPYFSGAYYYVGTYTVGEAETLTLEEFEQLPEKAQNSLVAASGRRQNYQQLRELYSSGKLTGLKFPVKRAGYNAELDQYLRQLANTC